MKVNKQIIKNYIKKNLVRISKVSNYSIFLRNSTNSFFNKISKFEKYQDIIEEAEKKLAVRPSEIWLYDKNSIHSFKSFSFHRRGVWKTIRRSVWHTHSLWEVDLPEEPVIYLDIFCIYRGDQRNLCNHWAHWKMRS